MNVDLAQAKLHLRVTSASEDVLIQAYVDAAAEWIRGYVTDEIDDSNPPADLIVAQLLLIGHSYQNREAVSSDRLTELPLGVEFHCQRYRKPTIS